MVSVHLSGVGSQDIRLQLDSGSDGLLLYGGDSGQKLEILDASTRLDANVTKAQMALAVLPPQDMRIGSLTLSRLSFVTPVRQAKDGPRRDEDGLLPTLLFQRVFISGLDHYVVLNPR